MHLIFHSRFNLVIFFKQGVVYTYGNIDAQMQGMIKAWGWSSSDVILHVLPLHHVHGVVNVLMTALYCGATCRMLPKFDAKEVMELTLKAPNTTTPEFANTVDPDETAHSEPSHLDLQCLPSSLCIFYIIQFILKVFRNF